MSRKPPGFHARIRDQAPVGRKRRRVDDAGRVGRQHARRAAVDRNHGELALALVQHRGAHDLRSVGRHVGIVGAKAVGQRPYDVVVQIQVVEVGPVGERAAVDALSGSGMKLARWKTSPRPSGVGACRPAAVGVREHARDRRS